LAKVLGVAATALAVAALANHAVARRSERRHPPCGSFIEVDGVRLHYVDRGEGVPVVLLHGNGGMIEDFEISGVLDAVARKHRVIVFDRPGFGYSERPRSTAWTAAAQAELLHQALGQLGVRRPVLVGHSWGTLVALSMALEHQAETGALVLLSGYYTPSLRLDVPLLAGPAIPVLGDLMRYTISPLLGWLLAPMVFRKIFAPAPVTSRFAAGFPTGLALRPWQIRASAADTALMIPAAASMLGRRGELTIPVVIVAGSEDKLVDTEVQSRGLHDDVAHSEMREVPGAGHMIHHTAPGEVVAAIDVAVRASMSAEAPGEVWPGHEAS
jgi:pimeloyl-ACP methyl ester carboxylesterase